MAAEALGECLWAFNAQVSATKAAYGSFAALALQLRREHVCKPHLPAIRLLLLRLCVEGSVALPNGWKEVWDNKGAQEGVDKDARKLARDFLNSLQKAISAKTREEKRGKAPPAPPPAHGLAPEHGPAPPEGRQHLLRPAAPLVGSRIQQGERSRKRARSEELEAALPSLDALAKTAMQLKDRLSSAAREYLGRCVCSCGQEHDGRGAFDSLEMVEKPSEADLRAGPVLSRETVKEVRGLELRTVAGRGAGVFATVALGVGVKPLGFDSFSLPSGLFAIGGGTPYSVTVQVQGESGERHPYQCSLAARVRCMQAGSCI